MERTKYYFGERIQKESLQRAYKKFMEICNGKRMPSTMMVSKEDADWEYDNIEEFWKEIMEDDGVSFDQIENDDNRFIVSWSRLEQEKKIRFAIRMKERRHIEEVAGILEKGIISSNKGFGEDSHAGLLTRSKEYSRTRYTVEDIIEAIAVIKRLKQVEKIGDVELWKHEEDGYWVLKEMDEALEQIRESEEYSLNINLGGVRLNLNYEHHDTKVTLYNIIKKHALEVLSVFEKLREERRVPFGRADICLFIGHGGNTIWKDLSEYLHHVQEFPVQTYEYGARSGRSVKEVLEEMSNESTMAFFVATGEDECTDGQIRARENVVHEIGLFQGRLGFRRAIILLEEGISEFSNIKGTAQIRFSKGNIREVFGDVISTIEREFPDLKK